MTEGPFSQPPDTVPVMAAVIRRADTVLVGLRPSHKRHGGLWEFPGGKVMDGETHLEAVRRELAEELAVEVLEVGPPTFSARDPAAPFVIHFVETTIEGEPRALEHQEIRWVSAPELRSLELAPADRRFVESRGPREPRA